jgi:hypothetical protein
MQFTKTSKSTECTKRSIEGLMMLLAAQILYSKMVSK